MDWRLQGGQNLEGNEIALDCGQGISEGIDAIRQYKPMTTSFSPNEVNGDLKDLWSPNDNEAIQKSTNVMVIG